MKISKEEKIQHKQELAKEKAEEIALKKKRESIYKDTISKQNTNLLKDKEAPKDVCISLQHVNKIYPNFVQAVYDFNLDIKEKEFIVFVGPSGCGKSTTLRMIAGLEDITYGDLYISGQFANTLLPKSRDCAMVFQTYALYPNMTVYDNMAFSLKVRHESSDEIKLKVLKAAKVLELTDYLGRKPSELSGGQRQRVALGRAIVRDAKVFLMDEPLSNLDAKLRVQMRSEIVSLHEKIGSTTVYVTHDQTEAMTMADRIVVMKDGYVQQIGKPKEIYNEPANIFVASFIGAPTTNMINVEYDNGLIKLSNGLVLKSSSKQMKEHDESINKEIALLEEKNKELQQDSLNLQDETFLSKDKLYKSRSFKKRIPTMLLINEEELKKNSDLIAKYHSYLKDKKHKAILGVRPEDIVDTKTSKLLENPSDVFSLKINQAELLGNEYYVYSTLDDKKVIAKISANEEVNPHSTIEFCINLNKIHLFDIDSTKRLF